MDKLDILTKMFAAFVNARVNDDTYDIYLQVLADVPAEDLSVLVRQVLSRPISFPPSPGLLLDEWRRAKGLLPKASGAERGWLAVLEALKTVPAKKLEDRLAAQAVKALGGMSVLRKSERPDIDRRDFFRVYEALANEQADEARMTSQFRRLVDKSELPSLEGDVLHGGEDRNAEV